MANDTVDITAWVNRFPLDVFLPKMQTLDAIFSQLDWAIIEQIRERAATEGPLGRSRATDSLVFIKGEGPRRDATKVGGAPYRSADTPWPRAVDRRTLTFLAQFSFTDSHLARPDRGAPGKNMVMVASNEYDNGAAGGDGNLTEINQYVDASTVRTTQMVRRVSKGCWKVRISPMAVGPHRWTATAAFSGGFGCSASERPRFARVSESDARCLDALPARSRAPLGAPHSRPR